MKRCFVVFLLLFASAACSFNTTPGSGEKIGQIVKLSKQGMIWKTWEAQLIRGGMVGGTGSFGTTPFDFTIEDEKMAKQAQEYMRNQAEVLITYRREGLYWLSRTDSGGDFLISIKPAF